MATDDLVQGMTHFGEHFTDYKDSYIIIGGLATAINQRRWGVTAKATKDFDIIVLDESDNSSFVSHFVDYVKNQAKYEYQGKFKEDGRILYQFQKPRNKKAPEMIELFTINELDGNNGLLFERLQGEEHFEYISAIVLNEEFREMLGRYCFENSNLMLATPEVLIPLKALAYVNLSIATKEVNRSKKQAEKHLEDIKSLAGLIADDVVEVSQDILENIHIVSKELQKIKGKEELGGILLEVYQLKK